MLKFIGGLFAGIVLVAAMGFAYAGGLMLTERESPFALEETVARIQANIEAKSDKGWSLSGLRSPSNAIRALGAYVPNVMLIETCSTEYSKPILGDDATRILSILMPCTITVYEKGDKVYIGTMNAGLMGWMFGTKVGQIMTQVAADQKDFLTFDPSKPAPKLKIPNKGGSKKGGGGLGALGGC